MGKNGTSEQRFNGSHKDSDPRTEAEKQAASARFRSHFGSVDLGAPIGTDNEAIDADLAREYADTHDECDVPKLIAKMRELRRGNTLGEGLSIRDLIDEGRESQGQ